MTDITKAIAAKQAKLKQLQSDLDALQRAASIIGGKTPSTQRKRGKLSAAARKALSGKLKAHWAKKKAANKPPPKKKRRTMSAAQRKAVAKRMKAYWAKRKQSGK